MALASRSRPIRPGPSSRSGRGASADEADGSLRQLRTVRWRRAGGAGPYPAPRRSRRPPFMAAREPACLPVESLCAARWSGERTEEQAGCRTAASGRLATRPAVPGSGAPVPDVPLAGLASPCRQPSPAPGRGPGPDGGQRGVADARSRRPARIPGPDRTTGSVPGDPCGIRSDPADGHPVRAVADDLRVRLHRGHAAPRARSRTVSSVPIPARSCRNVGTPEGKITEGSNVKSIRTARSAFPAVGTLLDRAAEAGISDLNGGTPDPRWWPGPMTLSSLAARPPMPRRGRRSCSRRRGG